MKPTLAPKDSAAAGMLNCVSHSTRHATPPNAS